MILAAGETSSAGNLQSGDYIGTVGLESAM